MHQRISANGPLAAKTAGALVLADEDASMLPNDLTSYDLKRAKQLAAQIDATVDGDETIDIMLALALYSVS